MKNMEIYEALKRPPKHALKPIRAGRLKGKSDINPQWRIEAMTKQFGPCGIGWKYEIEKLWLENGNTIDKDNWETAAFAKIKLYIKDDNEWSAPIEGVGGSAFVTGEKSGPHTSDEAYKMAITDGLSVAMKMLGMAADIYAGLWDGSKYADPVPPQAKITKDQTQKIKKLMDGLEIDRGKFLKYINAESISEIKQANFDKAVKALKSKAKKQEGGGK